MLLFPQLNPVSERHYSRCQSPEPLPATHTSVSNRTHRISVQLLPTNLSLALYQDCPELLQFGRAKASRCFSKIGGTESTAILRSVQGHVSVQFGMYRCITFDHPEETGTDSRRFAVAA